MKKIDTGLLLILLSCLTIERSLCFIGDLSTNFYFIKNMKAQQEDRMKEARGEEGEEFKGDEFGDRTSAILDGLLAKTTEISSTLHTMNDRMTRKLEQLESLVEDGINDIKKTALIVPFSASVDRIHYAFEKLDQFASEEKNIDKGRLERFIDDNINSQTSDGVEGHLEKLLSIVTSPSNPDNLISMMERIERKKHDKAVCGKTTPTLILHQFYQTIMGIELLGLATLTTGYMLKELLDSDQSNERNRNYAYFEHERRTVKYAQRFSPLLKRLTDQFRNCDPEPGNDLRDVTFYEMWGTFQYVILSEYNLWRETDGCSSWECPDFNGDTPLNKKCYIAPGKWTEWNDTKPNDLTYCTTPRACRGTLQHCKILEVYEACMMPNSTRRYEWIDIIANDSGMKNQLYGTRTDCEGGVSAKLSYAQSDGSYWSGGHRCPFCFCRCQDVAHESLSVFTISLLPARANTTINKVVIGVRFKIHENILHLQVKESKIVESYGIARNKKKWVKLPNMREEIKKNREDPENHIKYESNIEYAIISDIHAINFDDIQLPYPRLITGVRLGQIYSELVDDRPRRIKLEVESMEYDYKTGKLIQGTEEWTRPYASNHTQKLDPYLDLPTKRNNVTSIDSTNAMYIVLTPTDDLADAGQTMVPFFDAQTLEALPSTPLRGLGLHHRGYTNEGSERRNVGFIGLHAYTFDIGEFVNETYAPFAEEFEKIHGKNENQNIDDDDEDYEVDEDAEDIIE